MKFFFLMESAIDVRYLYIPVAQNFLRTSTDLYSKARDFEVDIALTPSRKRPRQQTGFEVTIEHRSRDRRGRRRVGLYPPPPPRPPDRSFVKTLNSRGAPATYIYIYQIAGAHPANCPSVVRGVSTGQRASINLKVHMRARIHDVKLCWPLKARRTRVQRRQLDHVRTYIYE